MSKTKHLDLGCGNMPRNPFFADELYGVDIIDLYDSNVNFNYTKANLSLESLPFDDNYFDSVSAYDFFEHILRVHIVNGITKFPFVELLSEIYRILKPGGQLYAVTPFYPKESAFVDPTHVNFITKNSHKYFITPHNWAQMYGFKGCFDKKRVSIVNFETELKTFSFVKKSILQILNFILPRRKQHIVWHFTALKTSSNIND